MKTEALMPITEVMPKPATKKNPFGRRATVKGNVRVEAYGDVDELNSTIEVVRAFNAESVWIHSPADRLEEEPRWMQNKLFDVGWLLATAPGQAFKNMPTVTARDAARLEKFIDQCQKDLPPLKEFVLPRGRWKDSQFITPGQNDLSTG